MFTGWARVFYAGVGVLFTGDIWRLGVYGCHMVEKCGLLEETRMRLTARALKRKIVCMMLLHVIIHSILFFGHFVAVRADKVPGLVTDIFGRRHCKKVQIIFMKSWGINFFRGTFPRSKSVSQLQ